ncbi:hypothetical protein [Streptomyces sp. A1547]|uniref:hypothetical protein n=1 Tax=Streptomyces sp. A1547 TaxID=2563105 RepID=UPI00109ED981|nr:hypothetical protein [Streptomyces sp. A1547]THA29839.1 hypothetical protein E6W17_38890 [Streptomyces sp. A1547]
MSSEDSAGAAYTEFVKDLLSAEEKRRESLESRGGAVIGVSGTLVTLLLALSALVRGKAESPLPAAATDRLSIAVLAFTAAALLSMLTYTPQRTRVTDPEALARLLPALWEQGHIHALKKTTAARLEQFKHTQRANDRKGRALGAAVLAQIVGVGALAAAVLAVTMT